ncbi:MAG: inositol monophosphatase [Ignavibacteriales bacterium]|nr:inositol monophosphatase [Ignavibacteriales bacterium]
MLDLAIEAATEAGRMIKMHSGRAMKVESKSGQETNLVTDLDRKAEELIIRTIKKRYHNHDFLAEESGSHETKSDYRWVIDPIDGTTNFTHGLPIYCVSIGLEHRGELILGVVYDPNRDELFTAEKGKGAFLNKRPIRVSGTRTLIEALVVTGFPYDVRSNPGHVVQHFNNFLMAAQAVRRLGSAALDLCYVAAGRFDGYWEVTLNPWDMAAGVLILEEAGGKFTDLEGFPSTIHRKSLLTSNGIIHEQMVEVLKRVKGEG